MASLDCLSGLIGIKGKCGTQDAPSSGLFVQDLPFVTIKTAEAGQHEDILSGQALIENKLAFAKRLVVNDIYSFFSSKIKQASIIENDTIGCFEDNLPAVATEPGKLKGIQIKIDQWPYLEFFVSSVTVQSQATGNISLFVYDLISGTLLDTLTVAVVAGVPTQTVVNKGYRTNRQRMNLIFVTDAAVGAYQSALHCSHIHSGSLCGECHCHCNEYVDANAIMIDSADAKIQSNIESNPDGTNGISITYSLNCVMEPFICSIANQLGLPLLYKFGSELMLEFQHSRRLNSVMTIHSKDADELRAEYELQYRSMMDRLLQRIELPDDICFYCDPKIFTSVRIP